MSNKIYFPTWQPNMLKFAMYGKEFAREQVEVTEYYLEIRSEKRVEFPERELTKYRRGISVVELDSPDLNYFTWLYNRVGTPCKWYEKMDNDRLELFKYLDQKRMFVCYYNGAPAGFSLINIHDNGKHHNQSNLSYFGLVPECVGLGIGKRFLKWTLNQFPLDHRIWVYTTNFDHPNALNVYKSCGFQLFTVGYETQYIPLTLLEQ